jgi:hypothetical protein
MRYGNTNLLYRPESLLIIPTKAQVVRHSPGTDISDCVPLGRGPTKIFVTLVAKSEEEKLIIEQLFHGDQVANLHIRLKYYKNVITGADPQIRKTGYNVWEITAEFIALDPVPYSAVTDEHIY